MWLVEEAGLINSRLGPEPLEGDFTASKLAGLLANRVAPVKAVLLDQKILAGVGNMYADESLFAAGIHPARPAGSLSPTEIERLFQAIQEVLWAAIGDKGASVQNYYRPDGSTGTAHYRFKVAHRRGENCPLCQTPLQRTVVRHRGTYFCPKCQPEL
jgi:formamidopyrimidine-DNA glycosylase